MKTITTTRFQHNYLWGIDVCCKCGNSGEFIEQHRMDCVPSDLEDSFRALKKLFGLTFFKDHKLKYIDTKHVFCFNKGSGGRFSLATLKSWYG